MAANIKVRNFQSISDADITVDGFTILVGESSQGKSACMRAVNAACNNRFKQGFLKYGTENMRIDIKYSDDDRTLTVTKNKKDSPTYTLGETVYQKLNRAVPPEIDDFNGFGSIDNYEQKYPLNFFTQFSKPLLLEFSQKRILEILSSSKAFDDMNDAQTKINKRKEQNNGAFKQLSSMITDNKRQLSEYTEREQTIHDGIESLKRAMSESEECDRQTLTAETLFGHMNAHTATERRVETLRNAQTKCELILKVNTMSGRLQELRTAITEHTDNEKRVKALRERETLCGQYNDTLTKLNSVRNDLLDELEKHIGDSRSAQKRMTELKNVSTVAEQCVNTNAAIKRNETERNNLTVLSDLMSVCRSAQKTIRDKQSVIDNHICPVCGNKIS